MTQTPALRRNGTRHLSHLPPSTISLGLNIKKSFCRCCFSQLSLWRSGHTSCVNDTSWVHVVAGRSRALTCLWVGNLAGPGDADDECGERGYKCFPKRLPTWYGADVVCLFCIAYLKKKERERKTCCFAYHFHLLFAILCGFCIQP